MKKGWIDGIIHGENRRTRFYTIEPVTFACYACDLMQWLFYLL